MIRIVKAGDRRIERFNARPAFPEEAEKAAAQVLADIRRDGDKAVLAAVAKFEGFEATKASQLKVDLARVSADGIDPKIVRAVNDAHRRVLRFSKASLRKDWSMKTPRGGSAGEFFSPMDRVGVYIPGGTAPLASTSVMTVTLAKAAGVKEIVACTPAGRDGKVNPVLLYALKLAGATEIYRVGGIQAIGLMAFGTKTCRKVQKIAGPGNAFVTAAKRQVYGYVAIDQVAGPSEIAVLTDYTNADFIDVVKKFLFAQIRSKSRNGFQLVYSSARMSKPSTAHFCHFYAEGGNERRNDKARFIAHSARRVLVHSYAVNGGKIEFLSRVTHGKSQVRRLSKAHSLKENCHKQRRCLIVGNTPFRIAFDEEIDFLRRKFSAVAFFADNVVHSHKNCPLYRTRHVRVLFLL